jgi:hypothetical protein
MSGGRVVLGGHPHLLKHRSTWGMALTWEMHAYDATTVRQVEEGNINVWFNVCRWMRAAARTRGPQVPSARDGSRQSVPWNGTDLDHSAWQFGHCCSRELQMNRHGIPSTKSCYRCSRSGSIRMPPPQSAQGMRPRGAVISHASASEGLQSTTVLTWGSASRTV